MPVSTTELDELKPIADKASYGKNLDGNIQGLLKRMKDMAYRPEPVREVLIAKEGKPGATRSLGISNLEDKIVQGMMQKVLESIYEPLFLECSYGFRPGIGCHDAIQDLQKHLYETEIQTVIDIDLKNFFGTIDHLLLEDLLKEKIKDPKFMRYISRMFKAGVLADGEMKVSEEGVVQGSICSPILANIFGACSLVRSLLPEKRRLVRRSVGVIGVEPLTEKSLQYVNKADNAMLKRRLMIETG